MTLGHDERRAGGWWTVDGRTLPLRGATLRADARAGLDRDEAGRQAAFDAATRARRLEAALDRDGLSTTARAVLARIRAR